MQLRYYQIQTLDKIRLRWQSGDRNVLAVLPTGAGKTVVFTRIMADEPGPCIAIAHRQELVCQISIALSRYRVRHRIIAPIPVIRTTISAQLDAVGAVYYDPNASVAVAGVDTLLRRDIKGDQYTLWVQDEAHHIQRNNKWGKVLARFPNARGLGVTATATRADGRGLGRANDSIFDTIVIGPTMRELIDQGYLSDYKIFAPKTGDLNLSDVAVGSTGDYVRPQLSNAVKKSRIVGDIVTHYKKLALGKLGVTFVVDVEAARITAEAFCDSGIRAAVVSHKTSDSERADLLKKFKCRDILQLVNVDLFGEGFDLPAIECVSFARPTASYPLYVQQFGRALRIMDGKDSAMIIDHVGNVYKHGIPDTINQWDLNRSEGNKRQPSKPVKVCAECTAVYDRFASTCPYCGYKPEPTNRSLPEYVDGDLTELDPFVLATLRAKSNRLLSSDSEYYAHLIDKNCPAIGINRNLRIHGRTREAQQKLRKCIAQWGAIQRLKNKSDSESYKRFYHKFGIDVLTAQTLNYKEANALYEWIKNDIIG